MISISNARHKYLIKYVGVSNFNIVKEYPFNEMISKISKCKPTLKSLSKYQYTKKRGKQNG